MARRPLVMRWVGYFCHEIEKAVAGHGALFPGNNPYFIVGRHGSVCRYPSCRQPNRRGIVFRKRMGIRTNHCRHGMATDARPVLQSVEM